VNSRCPSPTRTTTFDANGAFGIDSGGDEIDILIPMDGMAPNEARREAMIKLEELNL
jgi:hypothetical protein